MLRKLFVFLSIILLTGCASRIIPEEGEQLVLITTLDTIEEIREKCPPEPPHPYNLACVHEIEPICRVYVYSEDWWQWIEHEIAHCFGWTH